MNDWVRNPFSISVSLKKVGNLVLSAQLTACFFAEMLTIVSPMRSPAILWIIAFLAILGGPVCTAATLLLKGGNSIRGEIIAERHAQVVVDVGYDVLLVPTSAVSLIKRDSTEETGLLNLEEPSEARSKGIYYEPGPGGRTESIAALAGRLGQSVVQIRTPGGLGSGFIINEEGFLITNFHVIESETEITVDVYHQVNGQLERNNYRDVRIVALNRFADLALLQIVDDLAPKFRYVSLGDIEDLAVGESVFAIGSPLGLERTVTEGILSTKTREYQGWLYLQTTTQINPGNSGGPLFNRRGEVVGVTNMKLPLGEGLGFAIPVDYVKHFLQYRDAFAYDNDNPNNPYRYLAPPTAYVENKESE